MVKNGYLKPKNRPQNASNETDLKTQRNYDPATELSTKIWTRNAARLGWTAQLGSASDTWGGAARGFTGSARLQSSARSKEDRVDTCRAAAGRNRIA